MKVTTSEAPRYPTTTLNAIPIGTVFQGTIVSPVTGLIITGTFFKAEGPLQRVTTDSKANEVVVVQLDKVYPSPTVANVFLLCREVRNYRPAKDVEVKLTF